MAISASMFRQQSLPLHGLRCWTGGALAWSALALCVASDSNLADANGFPLSDSVLLQEERRRAHHVTEISGHSSQHKCATCGHVRALGGGNQREEDVNGEDEEKDADEDGEKDEGSGEEKGEEKGEEEASEGDKEVARMLLGSVIFIMTLFYLVNYRDLDIQYYAWSVISSTIVIFASLFIFSGVHRVLVKARSSLNLSHTKEIMFSYMSTMGWLCILKVVMLTIAGTNKVLMGMFGVGDKEKRDLEMRSWATLMAHIVGFASLHAGVTWQQSEWCLVSTTRGLLVVPVHVLILYSADKLLELCVSRIVSNGDSEDMQDRENLYAQATSDTMRDIVSLSASFMVVQEIRFGLSGAMPNYEGVEEPQRTHPLMCSLALAGFGCIFTLLVVIVVLVIPRVRLKPHLQWALVVLQQSLAMGFAWSVFFASKWELKRLASHCNPNAMMPRVTLALAVSMAGLVLIFFLDFLYDLEMTGDAADTAIKSIINSLGILVGFSWEQSFDGAVEVLSSEFEHPVKAHFAFASAVTIVIVPAWRTYILQTVRNAELRLEGEEVEAKARASNSRRASHSRSRNSRSEYAGATPLELVNLSFPQENSLDRECTFASNPSENGKRRFWL